jgi:hypothetical protein
MLGFLLLWCWDYPILLGYRLYQRVFGSNRDERDRDAVALPLLVVIPSLLRHADELTSMQSTVQSIAGNEYPGPLTIVVTIDGTRDAPGLYAQLCRWAAEQCSDRENGGPRLFVTGTPQRRSKPMAIEHAMHFVRELVASGELPAFPPAYVSTDADADLGPRALERIVYRLQRRHPITGWPARVVAGALHVRGNQFWKGWADYFTIAGQLNLQVAREYYVGNIWRYNLRWLPITGVPGAFYCTWSEIFLAIPEFMAYSRTLRLRHWLGWWLGFAPPRFSESTQPALPELMAGDTDDTVTAFAATIARYEHGRFSFDPPRTPVHALCHLLVGLFIDRALQYEPEARVFTSSPTTPKTLFRQRKRWNSSRVELTGRFWPVLGYHWVLGLPVMVVKLLIARTISVGLLAYLAIPVLLWKLHPVSGLVIGYCCNLLVFAVMTLFALLINLDFRYWRLALGLPLAPAYQLLFNWLPGTVGVLSDVFLFGNRTGFAPEATLMRGGSQRIALLFRLRRALLLSVRAVVVGDVSLAASWLGWSETREAPSGFAGWTSGKRRSIVPPLRQWFRPAPSSDDAAPAGADAVQRASESERG